MLALVLAVFPFAAGFGLARNFTQRIDHFSTSQETYQQRYYFSEAAFQGPGHPIFVIMGGEGAIPEDVGLFYPFVYEVLAKKFGALVIEPEHRFYGTSQPFASSMQPKSNLNLQFLTIHQALADAANFVVAQQKAYGCSERGTSGYCPVVTFGGSYPGFMSAMMRLRYPAVVDIGYAASAPMLFYAQRVNQASYYQIITASAERAVPGCPNAVRSALSLLLSSSPLEIARELRFCEPIPPYLSILADSDAFSFRNEILMLVMVQFANDNMANYPPSQDTSLARACHAFVSGSPWAALRLLLGVDGFKSQFTTSRSRLQPRVRSDNRGKCFDVGAQVPAGSNASISCGDWSGCGGGFDGQSWDYETCSLLVEAIGTNNVTDMFPERMWSLDWLSKHCQTRFGVTPRPRQLADEWGFDQLAEIGASHIIFTNGLNDGWSAGGFSEDLSDTLPVFNMPNGAHHSDLTHSSPSESDTDDVKATRAAVTKLLEKWLGEISKKKN